jgi:hypothetical protein
MATPPRKTGGGGQASSPPPPAAEPPQAAKQPIKRQAADAARPAIATVTTKTSPAYVIPPQGPGAPTRLQHDGAPPSEERLNTAMKALLDPAARTRFSRVYSGQARNWQR